MDGFKNSTRVQYMKGGACEGYAKGGKVRGAAKINKVMSEFKAGTLHSGSKKGPEVTSKKQAVAIAMSEARKAGAKMPVKRGGGTPIGKGPERASAEADDVLLARMSKDEIAMGAKGLKMARERMARERAAGTDRETRMTQREAVKPVRRGVPVAPREAMIGGREAADTYMARLPRGAVKPAQPGIPSYTPGTRSGLKKGGLAVMPKRCKK